MTQYAGVIGYPLKRALSVAIMRPTFEHLNLDIHYEAWETEEKQFESRANFLRQREVLGAMVTMPYKEKVIPFVDELDKAAKIMKAVNVISKQGEKLVGHNTDGAAFLQALTEETGFTLKGKQAVILGAGGVARACGATLATAGISSITIINRTLSRAHELASIIRQLGPEVKVVSYEDGMEPIKKSELLVNCTPLGMEGTTTEAQAPIKEGLISKDQIVFDTIYKPLETPLMKMARDVGAEALGGASMVVYTSIIAFRLWLHKEPPKEIMFEGARKAGFL
ncbi:shikimate dehydrogenase [Chloroflexota bacterium]